MKPSDKQMFAALRVAILKAKFDIKGEDALALAQIVSWLHDLEARVCEPVKEEVLKPEETKKKK